MEQAFKLKKKKSDSGLNMRPGRPILRALREREFSCCSFERRCRKTLFVSKCDKLNVLLHIRSRDNVGI